jgi:acyl-CoA synthetase (AMP-forming)/AMP-acid ligase II
MSELSTLVNILSDRVQEKPDREIFIFLQDGEQKTDSLTYLKLETRAKAIATYLQETITQGAHALLIFSPGIEFITAFFGCLYAGIVAVPIPLPHKRKLSRVKSVLADSQAAAILTTENLLGDLKSKLLEDSLFSTLQWIAVDRIDDRLASPWQKPEIGLSTLALLQYTSGSTGNPKGVTISHGNLLSNSHTIRESFNNNSKTSGVIWLPPYHDMGLIGGIVQPIYSDSLSILMPPQAFLQKPIRWLQTITRYKATISGGPDFAYDL